RILPDRWGTPIGPFTADEFRAQCLGPDRPGEIVVTGDHVLKGYLNGRGDAEMKFRVGDQVWHRTGDAGRVDEGGRLWLLGRCAARVGEGDGALYPFCVEAAATAWPGVARSAVVAVDGERVLVVEPESGERPDLGGLREGLGWAGIGRV